MPTKPSKIFSSAIIGFEAKPIEVEVDLSYGLSSFNIVGLPDKAVGEAKERVSSAIKNSGIKSPKKGNYKITVNLAPANLRKEGASHDLAIAIGFLLASEQAKFDPENKIFVGELALNGNLRPVSGVLATSLMVKNRGFKTLILPKENAREAALVSGVEVIGVENLVQTIKYLEGQESILPAKLDHAALFNRLSKYPVDMAWIKGQAHAKRALEIAAAGGHNILMMGPPGGGKTLLAKALASILPRMELDEALEVTRIYSVAGKLSHDAPLIIERPFRNPHHTASEVSLIGGGTGSRPGEISLAHRGVLFLDEFPEFHRDVIESLRQPLEDGQIVVSRAHGSATFPAKFILVASQNPCPCGYYEDPQKECRCSAYQIIKYQKKVSGPIGDRIDIHLSVPAVEYDELVSEISGDTSEQIRARTERARRVQKERFQGQDIFTNSEMNIPQVKKYCDVDTVAAGILKGAIQKYHLSARSYHRILKLARTIADLEGSEDIKADHIGEAVGYRIKDEF